MRKKRVLKDSKKKPQIAKKFAIDVSWVFISTIAGAIVGILFRILLGNYFGPKGLGLITMVTILTAIAGIFGDFGVPAVLVKYIAAEKENKKRIDKIISCSFINAIIFGFVLTFIFFIFANNIAALFGMPELAYMLKLVSIMFPFLIVNDIFVGIFNGYRWMKKYTVLTFVRRIGIIVIAWVLILMGWGVIAAIYALVIKEILTTIFNFLMMRNHKITISFTDHFATTKELFRFGKFLFFGEGVGYFNTYLDTFLIGYFLTDEHVGIYAIATLVIHFFLTIPFSISRISYPMTSELYAKKDFKKIQKVLNLCMRYSFFIVSVIGLLSIFFGKFLLMIVFPGEPKFLDAYLPLIILMIGVAIRSIFYSIESVFVSADRPDILLKIGVIASVVNTILNLILIPTYGISGGALATSISLTVSSIFTYVVLRKMEKISVELNWSIIGFISFLVIIILFYILQSFINQYILIMFFFPIYIFIIFISRIFTLEDSHYMRNIIFKKK